MNQAPPNPPGTRVVHHGRGGELFVVFIVNLVYKILTLGIYHFWAKTRIRRYIWTQTSFDGERFEYTGTGKELFFGFLKAMLLVAAAYTLFFLAAFFAQLLTIPLMIILYVGLPVLFGYAIYGHYRYLLTRTRWRGIRFGLTGSGWDHGGMMLGYGILTGLTLGLYAPYMQMKLSKHVLGNAYFGNVRFEFDGEGGDLFGNFFVAWLLTIPTLGLIWIWYGAREMRYKAEHLKLEGMSFAVDVTGGALFGLYLTNLLLLVITLGLGVPWVIVRTLNFFTQRLTIAGALDYNAVQQAQAEAGATTESLADALDLGAF